MRRPKREFTIFSLAAIDLFCSAMGAFMVISIILIPYFGRQEAQPVTPPAPQQDTQALEQKLAEQTKKADEASKQVADLRTEIGKLQDQASKNSMLALFGIVTRAKSITLVVDLSGSIYNIKNTPGAKDYRPVVQNVCDTIVDGMKLGQRLQIIGFHSPGATQVLLPELPGGPVVLDERSRQTAKSFVTSILGTVDGGTPTGPALRKALTNDTEAVFLITDGAPNDGQREGEAVCNEIINDIRSRNHGQKEIHCIAVGDYNASPYCVNFLMQLARANKGQFLGMPNL
ncbi:MAG: vWA domain-containing protein [Verrucomicrobiaceae bacterium]